MEKRKNLSDILFVPYCIIGTYILYIMFDLGYPDNIFEKICSKLILFVVMTTWIIFAYSFVRKRYISVVCRLKHNLIAVFATSIIIPLVFWFLDCCLYCLGGYNNTIVDMIIEAPVVFVKSYFMSMGFLRIVFWFAYSCVVCLLMHIGNKYHWIAKFMRRTGHVFDEDIVDVEGNTLVLPFKYKENTAKLYFAVNGKGMLLRDEAFKHLKEYAEESLKENPSNEDTIKFMELLNGVIELNSDDGNTFIFDGSDAEKFKWEHYEVREEDFWHELIPLNLVKHDESTETKKNKVSWSKLFSLSFIVPASFFGILTYNLFDICSSWLAYEPDAFISGLKYISYTALMLMIATVCNKFIVNRDSSKTRKIATCAISTLIVFASILLLNSAYHYLSFGDMFDWPQGVTYFMFVRDDLLYHHGIGVLRYPAVIILYLVIYFYQYFCITEKGWKILKEALIESLTANKE